MSDLRAYDGWLVSVNGTHLHWPARIAPTGARRCTAACGVMLHPGRTDDHIESGSGHPRCGRCAAARLRDGT